MSTLSKPPHGADPWWGETDSEPIAFDAPVATMPTAARSRAPRRARARRSARPWWMRLLALPFVAFGRAVRRSPRLRKLLVRLLIVAVVAAAVACSVGVILLNNVVIHRTAELGKLDQERRELRRDNAVLDAQAARKSSQTQIVARAEALGMKRATGAPNYNYLDPQSSDIAAKNRALAAARANRAVQAAKQQAQEAGR